MLVPSKADSMHSQSICVPTPFSCSPDYLERTPNIDTITFLPSSSKAVMCPKISFTQLLTKNL